MHDEHFSEKRFTNTENIVFLKIHVDLEYLIN